MQLRRVCPECGTAYEPHEGQTRATCPECHPPDSERPSRAWRGSPRERGYDERWRRLSERARRLVGACSDCGSPDDLTADHSAEAWERRARGLPIRLRDIDVVCRRCNSERGAARGDRAHEHKRWERGDLLVLADELDRDDDDE